MVDKGQHAHNSYMKEKGAEEWTKERETEGNWCSERIGGREKRERKKGGNRAGNREGGGRKEEGGEEEIINLQQSFSFWERGDRSRGTNG